MAKKNTTPRRATTRHAASGKFARFSAAKENAKDIHVVPSERQGTWIMSGGKGERYVVSTSTTTSETIRKGRRRYDAALKSLAKK